MQVTHSSTSILLAGVCATSLFLAPSSVKAQAFGYLALKTGYSHEMLPKTEFKTTKTLHLDASSTAGLPLSLGIGVGYAISPDFGIRAEAEYAYRFMGNFKGGLLKDEKGTPPAVTAKQSAQFQNLLGNLYFDYYISPSVNLYLSTGVGVGFFGTTTQLDTIKTTSKIEATLNWQVGFGLGYALTQDFGLDLNVRYVDFGKSHFESVENSIKATYSFSAVEALIGFNYRF